MPLNSVWFRSERNTFSMKKKQSKPLAPIKIDAWNDLLLWTLKIEKNSFSFSSLLRVQRIIQSCCDTLSYYMNNLFLYKTSVYNRAYGRLSDIDKEIFYDGSKVKFSLSRSSILRAQSETLSFIDLSSSALIYNNWLPAAFINFIRFYDFYTHIQFMLLIRLYRWILWNTRTEQLMALDCIWQRIKLKTYRKHERLQIDCLHWMWSLNC